MATAPARARRGRTVAVLAHGAGSTSDFVARAFPAAALGVDEVQALDDRTGDVAVVASMLVTTVRARHAADPDSAVVLGGVSLGAHAAARCAATVAGVLPPGALRGVVLALPAWTGAPDAVAAATAAAADDVAAHGSRAVLDRLGSDPSLAGDWVLAELARAWPTYGDRTLVRALRAAGSSSGPGTERLRSLPVPAAVVALADDPLHPAAVAAAWAAAVPTAGLAVVGRHEPAVSRGVLGRAAGSVLRTLGVTGA